ncbi:hypothetical protein [Bifidobacterium sp. ESL0732]|uniref:hypothetical protein n=1 Tax=Bifidobacterium sp. ESL0732 TaxID=2983222 RepID=UPI0023F7DA14|nr:hypothetical protein [Bifidobacterium sp. ESL0732]WEV63904.1 hypothetical protein OZX70_08255 [Bifidobacterium sp. ESL0732]
MTFSLGYRYAAENFIPTGTRELSKKYDNTYNNFDVARTIALEVIVVKGNDGYRRQEGLDVSEHGQGVKRRYAAKATTRIFAVLIVLATLLATLNGTVAPSEATAATPANDVCTTFKDANNNPVDWRSTDCPNSPTGASRKPMLFQILGDNNSIDSEVDEERVDAVIRVAHGEVSYYQNGQDGKRVATTASHGETGLKIAYNYMDGSDGNGVIKNNYRNVKYADTGDGIDGANAWAGNEDEFFTIHQISQIGDYDYVTISLEGDINYPDAGATLWWKGKTTKEEGRVTQAAPVYAIVGKSAKNDSSDFNYLKNAPLGTNIMENQQVHIFPGTCAGDSQDACKEPAAFLSWDGYGYYWTGEQPYWGMVTDYGLGGNFTDTSGASHTTNPNNYRAHRTSSTPQVGEGIAPKDSFLISWYYGEHSAPTDACHQYTSYWYQWVALRNNDEWVPVTGLTGDGAKFVTGQDAAYESGSKPYRADPKKTNIMAYNNNDPGKTNKLYDPDAKDQLRDGSIDFAKAKKLDDGTESDGYFKLVTWPNLDASGCATTVPQDNPGINWKMVNEEKTNKSGDVEKRLSDGWTMGTVFYKYSISRPAPPEIDKFPGYVQRSKRIITGTGIVGDTVQVYRSDPKNPFDPSDPQNLDRTGIAVGKPVVVQPKPGTDTKDDTGQRIGIWSVEDDDDIDSDKENVVEYHATQTDTSAFHVVSEFSNTAYGYFQQGINVNPEIRLVSSPHSTTAADGVTPVPAKGKKVVISGQVKAPHGTDRIWVYARPQTSVAHSSTNSTSVSTPTDGSSGSSESGNVPTAATKSEPDQLPTGIDPSNNNEVPDPSYKLCYVGAVQDLDVTKRPADGDTAISDDAWKANWTCSVDPSVFLDKDRTDANGVKTSNPYYHHVLYEISAVRQDVSLAGASPAIGRANNQIIDMIPPLVSVSQTVRRDKGLSGKVTIPETTAEGSLKPTENTVGYDGNSGIPVKITWPNGRSSTVKTDKDGNWHADIPDGMKPGNITVQATDRAGTLQSNHNRNIDGVEMDGHGNVSNLAKAKLTEPLPALALPFTGSRWFGVMLLLAGVTALLIAACVSLVWFRSRGQNARHSG